MPLIQIKAQKPLFPIGDMSNLSREQKAIVDLAEDLPLFILYNAEVFCLESDAPEEVTQVDIVEFSQYSVNTPDVWLLVQQTEELPIETQIAQRDLLRDYLRSWCARAGLNVSLALDIFFGPGHGWLSIGGVPEQTW